MQAKWCLKGKWDTHMDRAPVLDPTEVPDEKTAHKLFDKLRVGPWKTVW